MYYVYNKITLISFTKVYNIPYICNDSDNLLLDLSLCCIRIPVLHAELHADVVRLARRLNVALQVQLHVGNGCVGHFGNHLRP